MSESSIISIVFLFFALVALFPILRPEVAARLSARYFTWSMKIFGFDADVRVTPRAVKICRAWNLSMLCILAVIFLWCTLVASPQAQQWWKVDRCLDSGGRWNDALSACEH